MRGLGRRRVLGGLGTAAFSAACCKREPSDAFFCANDPTISDPATPLTIDVHTHVFNGSDLQIFGFYNYVVARKIDRSLLATILQMVGSELAPTAAHEMAALQQVEEALRSCNTT